MTDRDDMIERQLGAMRDALEAIADYGDCDYELAPRDDLPKPCPCPRCRARRALATEERWRVQGARFERTETMPRELAIMKAWERYIFGAGVGTPDFKLGQILGECHIEHPSTARVVIREPSPRDWFVASTVIQWLATNVGSSLLYEAGYRYDPPKTKGAE